MTNIKPNNNTNALQHYLLAKAIHTALIKSFKPLCENCHYAHISEQYKYCGLCDECGATSEDVYWTEEEYAL